MPPTIAYDVEGRPKILHEITLSACNADHSAGTRRRIMNRNMVTGTRNSGTGDRENNASTYICSGMKSRMTEVRTVAQKSKDGPFKGPIGSSPLMSDNR